LVRLAPRRKTRQLTSRNIFRPIRAILVAPPRGQIAPRTTQNQSPMRRGSSTQGNTGSRAGGRRGGRDRHSCLYQQHQQLRSVLRGPRTGQSPRRTCVPTPTQSRATGPGVEDELISPGWRTADRFRGRALANERGANANAHQLRRSGVLLASAPASQERSWPTVHVRMLVVRQAGTGVGIYGRLPGRNDRPWQTLQHRSEPLHADVRVLPSTA
jgi:hypothetical protein